MKYANKTQKTIDRFININPHNVIGIAIYNKGKEIAYNLTDKGVNQDDLFYDLGSISKTFTAHLILKMSQDGELDLDKHINEYVNLKNGKYPTIKELLSHQSGYRYLTPFQITIKRFLTKRYAKANIYENITTQDVIKHIKPRKKKSYSFHYSDFNYAILASIISIIKNKPFGDIMQEFIQNDLKLNHTFMSYGKKDNLSSYSFNKKLPSWKWNKDNPYLSGGGISSSVLDALNYIKLEINSHEKYIKNAHVSVNHKKRFETCFGWHKKKDTNKLFHVGRVGNFTTYILVNPHKQIGVCLTSNTLGIKGCNVAYIANMIYSDLLRNKVVFD